MPKKGNFKILIVETLVKDEERNPIYLPVDTGDFIPKTTDDALRYIKKNGNQFKGKTIMVIDLKVTVEAKVKEVEPQVLLETLS